MSQRGLNEVLYVFRDGVEDTLLEAARLELGLDHTKKLPGHLVSKIKWLSDQLTTAALYHNKLDPFGWKKWQGFAPAAEGIRNYWGASYKEWQKPFAYYGALFADSVLANESVYAFGFVLARLLPGGRSKRVVPLGPATPLFFAEDVEAAGGDCRLLAGTRVEELPPYKLESECGLFSVPPSSVGPRDTVYGPALMVGGLFWGKGKILGPIFDSGLITRLHEEFAPQIDDVLESRRNPQYAPSEERIEIVTRNPGVRRSRAQKVELPLGEYEDLRVRVGLIRDRSAGKFPDVEITSSDVVYKITKSLASEPVELILALLLDARNRVIGVFEAARGNVSGASVEPRVILQAALVANAVSLILVHNHPSGDQAHSSADSNLTRVISEASGILGIRFLDHVIVGQDSYESYAELGLL